MSFGQTADGNYGQGADVFDSFDFDGVDPDAPGSHGGGSRLPEGGYKFVVTEVIVKNDRGSTVVELEVVDAKDAGFLGKKHTEYLSWPDGEHSADYNRIKKEQLLAWCYAAKTTSAEEIKARQQARQGFNSGWLEQMVGRAVLGFVKVESYTGRDGGDKTSSKIEGRVYALDNPKGKGIPGWIDVGPAKSQTGPSVQPQGQQTQQQQQQSQPAVSNPFAGLA